MDSIIISLEKINTQDESFVGGKASKLSKLKKEGFKIPPGFCLTTLAYNQFVKDNRLDDVIQFELGRMRFIDMRWEEIWDASLRIRARFQQYTVSH